MGLSTLKGNSGYMGIDKRNSVTGNTIGNISSKKFFLERLGGNLQPIVPPVPNPLFQDNFSTGNFSKWNVVNGGVNTEWIVGTGTRDQFNTLVTIPSGSTYAAYPSSDGVDNIYLVNNDVHIYFDFDIPEGTTSLTLEFDWLCYGERTGGYTGYDFGYIMLADPDNFTPSAGSEYGAVSTNNYGRIIESNTADNTDSGKFTGDGSDARSDNTSKNSFVYENITINSSGTNIGSIWCTNCTRRLVFSWTSDTISVVDNPSWSIANIKLSYNL